MGYQDRPYAVKMRFGPPSTPRVIKILILLNVAIYVVQNLWGTLLPDLSDSLSLERIFGVSTVGLVEKVRLWQPLTYMFLHDPLGGDPGFFHIVFNMLILWMFGAEVAARLGPRTFLGLYLGGGIFAGLCYSAFAVFSGLNVPCIGASGAVMAVIVYSGFLFPNRTVLFMFFFPMKMRTLVFLIIGLDLFYFITSAGGGVAHSAHLGGALFGWLHVRYAHVLDRYFTKLEVKAEQQKVRQEEEMRAEVDRLLEKIHQEGLGALSDREKKFLKRSSRRFEKKT